MAFHPFRTFQRNQKGCMAGATLLAIISFLFLGVIIQLLGGRGGAGRRIETIAETRRFGKITDFELSRLQRNQETLRRFVIVLYQNLAAVNPADEERMAALRPLQMFANQAAQLQSPEQLINVWLVSQYAHEEGLTLDWSDVSKRLKELTGDYLSDAVYNGTLQSVGISHQAVEKLLSQHFRWEQSLERFSLSVDAISPATRWDWYQRLYRQITIEAAAVPVDSLLAQVGEPNSSQLNDLFAKYKTKRFDPMSDESGFIMPTELAFQYIIADPNQEQLDSITDEEMLAYYEENKDTMFRKQLPFMDMPQFRGMMPGGVTFPTQRSGMPSAPLPDGGLPSLPELPEIPDVEDESAPQPQETSETSKVTPRVTTRLVSYQADEENEDIVTAEIQADESASVAPDDTPVDLSILYKPFDEVKDQIRKNLAIVKATEGFPVILKEMQKYSTVYHGHFEQGKVPPPMPDLTNLAAEQGLKLVTVPMGDVYAALRTDLARGLDERQYIAQMFHRVPLMFEGETFWGREGQVLCWVTDQKIEKRPEKLDEVKDAVLKRWKEIEAGGLALKKAEELAGEVKASGQSLAEVFAGREDVPVVETEPFTWKSYGMNPMAALMRGVPPMLGEVREKGVAAGDAEIDNRLITAPGSDFMETVFSLSIGETGVVFNQPKSVAYIVRVTSSSPSTEVLWEQFQNAPVMLYRAAGQMELFSAAYQAWLDEIRSKTGFRWVNKPDAREREVMEDEGY